MPNYSIFDFGELFQLDSPLTAPPAPEKKISIAFKQVSHEQDIYVVTYTITHVNLNRSNLWADVSLDGEPAFPFILHQRLALSSGPATYNLRVQAALIQQVPEPGQSPPSFTLTVACDGVKATSLPFGLPKWEAVGAASREPAPAGSREAESLYPQNFALTQQEVNRIATYADAYSRGKYPDIDNPPPPRPALRPTAMTRAPTCWSSTS